MGGFPKETFIVLENLSCKQEYLVDSMIGVKRCLAIINYVVSIIIIAIYS